MAPCSRTKTLIGFLLWVGSVSGCAFGPRMLESTHGRYNEAVKQVTEEQLLLNLVRLRYNDSPMRLDVSSIAAQYELEAAVEARPFFGTDSTSTAIQSFSRVLPFGGLRGTTRPTISMTPLDDPETLRSLFTPSSLDSIVFLSETSFPVSTVYRLAVEHLNHVPNAPSASGPAQEIVPDYHEFLAVAQMLQALQDRGELRFIREETVTELGSPLPSDSVTAAALVEAAKNGYEYRQKSDNTWVLSKRDRRLQMKVDPQALEGVEMREVARVLNLMPGQSQFEVVIGGHNGPFLTSKPSEPYAKLHVNPRSPAQTMFYLSKGVVVPPEHFSCGIVTSPSLPDGTVFDWNDMLGDLFRVCSVKQKCRPSEAYVAVNYRDHWFYIDDRDAHSKITFSLVLAMTHLNLTGVRKGGPALTLPVGR